MKPRTEAGEDAISSPWKVEVGAKRRVGVIEASRFDRTPAKTAHARKLRREMTPPELKLWARLRANQVRGFSFRRQHPIGSYVLDFYCPRLKLVIEAGGTQHGLANRQRADLKRSEWLAKKGIQVLRFWNEDVMRNTQNVLDEIDRVVERFTSKTPTRSAAPTDLPLSGGGNGGSLDIVFGEVDR